MSTETLSSQESEILFRTMIEAIRAEAKFPFPKVEIPKLEAIKALLNPLIEGEDKRPMRNKMVYRALEEWVTLGLLAPEDIDGSTHYHLTAQAEIALATAMPNATPSDETQEQPATTVLDDTSPQPNNTTWSSDANTSSPTDKQPSAGDVVSSGDSQSSMTNDDSYTNTASLTDNPSSAGNVVSSGDSQSSMTDDDSYMPKVSGFLNREQSTGNTPPRRRSNFGGHLGAEAPKPVQHPSNSGDDSSSIGQPPVHVGIDEPQTTQQPEPLSTQPVPPPPPPRNTSSPRPPKTNPPPQTQPLQIGRPTEQRTGPRQKPNGVGDNVPNNTQPPPPTPKNNPPNNSPTPNTRGVNNPPTSTSKPPTNPSSGRATAYQNGTNPRDGLGWAKSSQNSEANDSTNPPKRTRQPQDFRNKGPRNNPPPPPITVEPQIYKASDGRYYYFEEQLADGRVIRLSKEMVDDWRREHHGTLIDAINALRRSLSE